MNSPWTGASSRAGAIFGVNNRSIGEGRSRVAVTEVAAGGEGAADGVVEQKVEEPALTGQTDQGQTEFQ